MNEQSDLEIAAAGIAEMATSITDLQDKLSASEAELAKLRALYHLDAINAMASESPAPWSDSMGHVWEIKQNVTCVECPHCCFTFAAEHTSGKVGYDCPNCNGCPDAKLAPTTGAIEAAANDLYQQGCGHVMDVSEIVAILSKHLPPDARAVDGDAREVAQEIVSKSAETRYLTSKGVDVLCSEENLINAIAAAITATKKETK